MIHDQVMMCFEVRTVTKKRQTYFAFLDEKSDDWIGQFDSSDIHLTDQMVIWGCHWQNTKGKDVIRLGNINKIFSLN